MALLPARRAATTSDVAFADLTNDVVVRRVFATRPDILRGLRDDLLERTGDQTIEVIEYLPSQHLPLITGAKLSLLGWEDGERMSWKEMVAIFAICAATLALLIFVDAGSPAWLHAVLGVLLFAATVAPALPFLVLIPWHFISLHRGLIRRGRGPCVVSISQGAVHVKRADKVTSHALGSIVRARFTRNDNWTESKMLEDALGLFASNGREIERLPESATGFDELLVELGAGGIPIEHVDVSAPAVLD